MNGLGKAYAAVGFADLTSRKEAAKWEPGGWMLQITVVLI